MKILHQTTFEIQQQLTTAMLLLQQQERQEQEQQQNHHPGTDTDTVAAPVQIRLLKPRSYNSLHMTLFFGGEVICSMEPSALIQWYQRIRRRFEDAGFYATVHHHQFPVENDEHKYKYEYGNNCKEVEMKEERNEDQAAAFADRTALEEQDSNSAKTDNNNNKRQDQKNNNNNNNFSQQTTKEEVGNNNINSRNSHNALLMKDDDEDDDDYASSLLDGWSLRLKGIRTFPPRRNNLIVAEFEAGTKWHTLYRDLRDIAAGTIPELHQLVRNNSNGKKDTFTPHITLASIVHVKGTNNKMKKKQMAILNEILHEKTEQLLLTAGTATTNSTTSPFTNNTSSMQPENDSDNDVGTTVEKIKKDSSRTIIPSSEDGDGNRTRAAGGYDLTTKNEKQYNDNVQQQQKRRQHFPPAYAYGITMGGPIPQQVQPILNWMFVRRSSNQQ
jgi:2'-5' RNA ligase